LGHDITVGDTQAAVMQLRSIALDANAVAKAVSYATVLNSPRAVQMSVYVVRAIVKLREVPASNSALARRRETLERSVAALDADTRKQFDQVYEAILGLMAPKPSRN
jgi:hypothetical protein